MRRAFLEPYVGDLRARQIAVFTSSAINFTIALVFLPLLRTTSRRQLLAVGFLWLGLTVAFEIIFGRFVIGASWPRLASDYNPMEGGLLPIGLLVLALSPLIAAKFRDGVA